MIIKSLLSQDFYKFTMQKVFVNEFDDVNAKYRFKCRNKDINLLPFKEQIEMEIDNLCKLTVTQDECFYLSNFFNQDYIDFLKLFQLSRDNIKLTEVDGKLDIMANGELADVTMFEIFVMKIVHEIYSRNVNPPTDIILEEGRNRLIEKIKQFKEFERNYGFTPVIVDFGGRRAYTVHWHEFVVKQLQKYNVIIGTSDVDIARRLKISCIGTMAHEYIQSFQAFFHPMDSQKRALETWYDTYGENFNVALSDTLGDKKFLIDFDKKMANVFKGVRHDSGDPFGWGDMMICHYNALGIDPMDKTLTFSDGLDFNKMFELSLYFKNKINVNFGIGTFLTNDLGVNALQNVMKLIEVDGKPVAKISNNPDKAMCEDQNYLNYLKGCLQRI